MQGPQQNQLGEASLINYGADRAIHARHVSDAAFELAGHELAAVSAPL